MLLGLETPDCMRSVENNLLTTQSFSPMRRSATTCITLNSMEQD